jgi:predicted secreted hydrolase
MKRLVLVLAALAAAALGTFWVVSGPAAGQPRHPIPISRILRLSASSDGFARALGPRPFTFPADHGPHPDFRNEWWYLTGNLTAPGGRRFGYQFTVFRAALAPSAPVRASAWGTRQVELAHVALTDVEGKRLLTAERWERAALGLAGASAEPFAVWVGPWNVSAMGPGVNGTPPFSLVAADGSGSDSFRLDLALSTLTRPVPEGDRGWSVKSEEPGNASYQYSLPRLATRGTLAIGRQALPVSGLSWFDREWSTSALGRDEIGWDWFGLQLDDGRCLTINRLRRRDGSADPATAGTLISAAGRPQRLLLHDLVLEPRGTWQSPESGARYPAAWHVAVPSAALDLTIEPRLADQELRLSFLYWEGAVAVHGRSHGATISGSGYLEMTGYGDR